VSVCVCVRDRRESEGKSAYVCARM